MNEPGRGTETARRVYVWDLPTRLFHWILVAAVATSLAAEQFGNMNIHVISGHVVVALVIFRICWGVVGGRHARFGDFVTGPGEVLAYLKELLKGKSPHHLGHNPLGGWSVIALLTVLGVQAGTGLFSNDDILTEGPLAASVGKSMSDTLTYYHGLSSNVLYALIGLHLAAIAFYTAKGHALIGAMVGGEKDDAPGKEMPGARGNLVLAAVIVCGAATIAYAIFNY